MLILTLITISTTTAAATSCDSGNICVNETGWWHDGSAFNSSTTPIQAAVDNAGSGETICVAAGSYTENVDIATPHLTLRGKCAGVVTVNAESSSNHVFEVTANYVNISGFNATGATSFPYAGIYLGGVDHCNISENTASNNYYGIYLDDSSNNMLVNNTASNNSAGIELSSSSNNTLTNNTASNNKDGIELSSSSNYNTLTNNTASNNSRGIYLYSSSNYNTLTGNNCSNNYDGIVLSHSSNYNTLTSNTASLNDYYGIHLYSSSNNTLTGSNCSNNSAGGIHLGDSSNNTLTSNTASNNSCGIELYSSNNYNTLANNTVSNNVHGIYLRYSSNYNTLVNNTASNNNRGIELYSSSNYNTLTSNTANSNDYHGIYLHHLNNYNMLTNNTASNNNRGIELYSSSNNTLVSNTANSNDDYGIYLYESNDNLIYNNYFNNTKNAYGYGSNQWNTTKTNGTNIIGEPFLGGNYWSDYAGVDNDGDGLGDTLIPYNSSDDIENGGDYHPLVILDYTPPLGITYLQNITHARTYINWTWTDPADPGFLKVMVYLDGVFQENVNNGVQCYNATLLTPGTTYEIGTKTVDTTGNINHTWVNHTATTASTTDTTAPVISNVTNTDPTTDSVTITWDTDEDSDSVVRYGTTPGNYTNEESNTALVTLHNICVSYSLHDLVIRTSNQREVNNDLRHTRSAIEYSCIQYSNIRARCSGSAVVIQDHIRGGNRICYHRRFIVNYTECSIGYTVSDTTIAGIIDQFRGTDGQWC